VTVVGIPEVSIQIKRESGRGPLCLRRGKISDSGERMSKKVTWPSKDVKPMRCGWEGAREAMDTMYVSATSE
jgi:hypothetical protein